jgi:hypothetical protein
VILRFTVPGSDYDEVFDLYSTQAESVIGLIEGMRTACLDLTADVTVLAETNRADIVSLQTLGGGAAVKGVEMQRLMAKAEAFHTSTVSVGLEVEKVDSRGGSREVKIKALLLPAGAVKRLAEFAIEQTRAFQLAVAAEARLSDSAVHLIRTTLDATLSHPLVQATVKPFELLAADISDEELAEALLPVKKPKAKKAKADLHAI